MKNVIKSKKVLIGIISIILIIILMFFVLFFSNNKTNKLKGSVSDFTNYSDGFTDSGFYACVVNSYNKENNAKYLINQKLTDEQLASIQTVECNTSGDKYRFDGEEFTYGHPNYNEDLIQLYKDNLTLEYTDEYYSDYVFANFDVKNINGIEKLTGLKKFVAVVLEGDNVDLSKNVNLEYLDLYLPETITELDLSNNEKLVNLLIDINSETFNYVGLDKLVNLKELYMKNSSFLGSEYDFLELVNLEKLEKLSLLNIDLTNLNPIKDLENIKELAIEGYSDDTEGGVTLADLKSIQNISYLYYDFNSVFIGELPELPNLISLNSRLLSSFDYTKLVNLKKVILPNIRKYEWSYADYMPIKSLSEYTELKVLKNLEYLIVGDGYHFSYAQSDYSWRNIDALDWFPKLHTLVVNNSYSNTSLTGTDSLKTLYTLNSTITYPYNLKLENVYGSSPRTLMPSNYKEIYIDNVNYSNEYCSYYNDVTSYSNLEEFYPYSGCEINASNLLAAKNLKKAYLSRVNWDIDELDVRNFPNLNTLVNLATNINTFENITNVLNSETLEHYTGYAKAGKNIITSNLKYLDVYGDINEINFDLLPDLIYLNINDEITKYKFDLSNNKELLYLELDFHNNSQELLIPNCDKLNALRIWNDSLVDSYQYVFLDKTNKVKSRIKLPRQFYFELTSGNEYVEFENGYFKGKEIGSGEVEIKLNNYNPGAGKYKYKQYSGSYTNVPNYNDRIFNIEIIVSDITSNDFNINKDEGYIYIKNVTEEKDVINGINYLPFENIGVLHSAINKNNLKSFILADEIDDFKIIKIMSNKYEIKDNDITYYGEFNIDNIRVTNAQKEVNGDKLIIKYNNKVIDEFNLIKLNSLIGDTNDDGEVTISDIILQYKHVEYELDITEDVFYRADMDTNDDVEKKDVKALYSIIKNN